MTVQPSSATGWIPQDTFKARLRLVREELGLTVREAAARCGFHYATWSTWERGTDPRHMVAVVEKISATLGVDRDWLMWGGPLRRSAPTLVAADGVDETTEAPTVGTVGASNRGAPAEGLEPSTCRLTAGISGSVTENGDRLARVVPIRTVPVCNESDTVRTRKCYVHLSTITA